MSNITSELALPSRLDAHESAEKILGIYVDSTSYQGVIKKTLDWAAAGDSRYVCVSTVHMVMEAFDDQSYQDVVNGADLVTPDGMPLVWCLRALGRSGQQRVYGPDLTEALLAAAAQASIPVGFYGGRPEVLKRLLAIVAERFPGLEVAYSWAPPFRVLTNDEQAEIVSKMNSSGMRILFVGLGCPKQERWMAAHKEKVGAVMLGVGAAFDFLAGTTRQAPRWMMRSGLEWLFRLVVEPRRLWKRYLKNNPRFVFLFLAQRLLPHRGA